MSVVDLMLAAIGDNINKHRVYQRGSPRHQRDDAAVDAVAALLDAVTAMRQAKSPAQFFESFRLVEAAHQHCKDI